MAGKHKTQKSLTEWTQQDWRTADGKRARRKGGTARYLPAAAWEALTPEQVVATNKKKREASKKGKQYVANTKAAREAGRRARS